MDLLKWLIDRIIMKHILLKAFRNLKDQLCQYGIQKMPLNMLNN